MKEELTLMELVDRLLYQEDDVTRTAPESFTIIQMKNDRREEYTYTEEYAYFNGYKYRITKSDDEIKIKIVS